MVDVVPGFNRKDGGYLIPNSVSQSWISTEQEERSQTITIQNEQTEPIEEGTPPLPEASRQPDGALQQLAPGQDICDEHQWETWHLATAPHRSYCIRDLRSVEIHHRPVSFVQY